LTGSIPDLKFDRFIGDVDHTGPEFYTNGKIVDRLKALIGELEEEAGFPYTCFAFNDVNCSFTEFIGYREWKRDKEFCMSAIRGGVIVMHWPQKEHRAR
jgi:hypothetical protein